MTPADRAVRRIREEMMTRTISQRDLAEKLRCSQGRIAKMMNGRVELRLNDVAAMADAVGIPLTEAVRDQGLEFYAEMTPSEVRIIQRLRQRPDATHALMTLLDVAGAGAKKPSLTPAMRPRGRPRTKALASSDESR